jgi:hypothetical protein
LIVIALALLLIFDGFYTAYNAATIIPTQLPPALSVTSNTLYHADWSQGMNGWKGGAEWKWIENGVVGSDGGEGSNYGLLAPYHSMSADYAVEAQVQVIRFTASSSGDVGLLVRADMGENGYFCGIDATRNMMVALVRSGERLLTPLSMRGPKLPPGLQYHLFRVEVRKNIITCFIDGHQAAQAADNDYLTAGMVGLRAVNAVIDVHGFQVLKLQN